MSEETVVYVKKGLDRVARTTSNLLETNDLTTGQVFFAIANHYEKDKNEYPRWISFGENKSEFDIIKDRVEECDNDLEKIHLICDWLGEDPIL